MLPAVGTFRRLIWRMVSARGQKYVPGKMADQESMLPSHSVDSRSRFPDSASGNLRKQRARRFVWSTSLFGELDLRSTPQDHVGHVKSD